MKCNLLTAVWAGLMLGAAGIMTAQAQNTYITFSVDESSNLVNGSFNPPAPAYVGGTPYGGTGTDGVYSRGIFDGWAYPGLQLVQVGTSPVYTNTVDDTSAQDQSDGNVNFIYDDTENGGEAGGDYHNRMAYLPKGNNVQLILPTAYFNDLGPAVTNHVKFQVDMSQQIELGAFHPGLGDFVVVAGSYQNFVPGSPSAAVLTNDPSILVTNYNFTPPVIESNVWVGTVAISTDSRQPLACPNCAEDYKFVIMPEYNWDSPQYPNLDPDSGNRFFTEADQTLPLVNFNDAPLAPLANVTFNVDMSGVARYDTNFIPNTVTAWGSFNGWVAGVTLTNNPAAPNTNLYSATVTAGEGTPYILQFRYTNSFTGVWVYDYAQDGGPNWVNNNNYRHVFNLPVTATPLATNLNYYFNDLAPDDYLPQDTAVEFSVDMNGAVGNDGHQFDPIGDNVYINGMFAGATPSQPSAQFGTAQLWYPWSSSTLPMPAPNGYQMIQEGATTVYTNTIIMPRGTPVALSYQYGMDETGVGGPVENEAVPGLVHYRGVRSTQFNPYVMPTDAFSSQPYVEPFFSTGNIGANGSLAGGNLTVGTPVAGRIPVSWLGRPGANLQSASSVSGPWQNILVTDGTTWTTGNNSTNGFMSVTNWPFSGNTLFRLVKP